MENDRLDLDLGFWGVRLAGPNKVLTCAAWDFERIHIVICEIVRLCGVEIAETFLGVVLPATLRDRENGAVVTAAPLELQPEVRMHTSGSRWADIRVALENRLPYAREALGRVVAALASPSMLGTVLGELMVSQGEKHMPTPVIHQGKLIRGVFARPQDVYSAILAVGMENLFPLDAGAPVRKKLHAEHAQSLPAILHWRAYSAQ